MKTMKGLGDQPLDAVIHALQNLPSWNIHALTADKKSSLPWLECTGPDVAEQLVIRESNLAIHVQTIGIKVMEWGVLAAQAQLVWTLEQRLNRTWKAKLLEASMQEGQKLTEKQQEALYRAHPDYELWEQRIERAAFALNCTQAACNGFRAKQEMLKAAIRPSRDGGLDPSFGIP